MKACTTCEGDAEGGAPALTLGAAERVDVDVAVEVDVAVAEEDVVADEVADSDAVVVTDGVTLGFAERVAEEMGDRVE